MRLEHDASGAVVLYDDHGQQWRVTLVVDGAPTAGGGDRDGQGKEIRIERPGSEIVRVPFNGEVTDAHRLALDDVVPYFLDAAG